MNKKVKVGFFKFSCCAGCEFQVFFFQNHLKETLNNFEFTFARMLRSGGNAKGPFDIALIEGTITESWQVDELKRIRENSKILFTIGSCAIDGGIPALKALKVECEVQKLVYKDLSDIHSMKPSTVNSYVRVDGYIRGCPPGERDLYEAFTSVLTEKKPEFIHYSVCIECKLRGNICILVADGIPCMGPVTNAGCGALCPSMNRGCYGCFGFMKQSNTKALIDKFKMLGLSYEDIKRKFTLFGSISKFSSFLEDMYED